MRLVVHLDALTDASIASPRPVVPPPCRRSTPRRASVRRWVVVPTLRPATVACPRANRLLVVGRRDRGAPYSMPPHAAWRLLGAPSSAARRHAMVVCMPTVSLRWVAVTAPPLPHTAWRLLGAPIQRARSRVLCCPARHHVAQCCAHSPGIVPPRTAGIVLLHTIWLADVLTSPHTVLPSPTMSRCGALCTARRCPASAHSRRTAGGVPSVSPHRAAACVSAGSRLACELCGSSSTLTHSLMHPLLRRGRQRTVVVRPVVSPPCHHTAPQHASVPARVLPVNYAARRPP